MTTLIQLITAFLGSLGFAMLFNIRKDKLLLCSLGGLLAWSVYLSAGFLSGNDVIRYFLASIVFTIYAEIMARIKKTPATIFIVSAAIPLIPGGYLYETMQYVMLHDWASFSAKGLTTLLLAFAIVAGMLVAVTLRQILLALAASN